MPLARTEAGPTAGRRLALAIVLGLGVSTPHAQTATWAASPAQGGSVIAQKTYSLPELIQLALAISPKNAEVQQQVTQADLAGDLVKSKYAPQVSLKALGGIEHTPLAIPQTVLPRGYFISSSREIFPTLELKWLLFDFGRRKSQVEEAAQNARAADFGLTAEQDRLIFDVSKAYFDATSSQGKVRAAEKALHAARMTEEAVTDQRSHGRATVVQVAQAHRQAAAAQLALTKTSGDAETAFATLVATVGLPPGSRFELLSPKDSGLDGEQPLQTLNALIDEAMQSRPDIQSAMSKIAAAQAKLDTAHAAYHPTISIQAQVLQNIGETSSDGSPYSPINRTGDSIFVAFELPLFDGGNRSTNVALAVSQKTQAEDALAATRNTVAQQVVESYSNLKTSLDNRREAVAYTKAAELAYQASLDSYRHGLSSVTDLTNDEAALAQAEANQEDADANVLVARAALALALGRRTAE